MDVNEAQVKGYLILRRDQGLSTEEAARASGLPVGDARRIDAEAAEVWSRMDADREATGAAYSILNDRTRERIRRTIAEQGPFSSVQAVMDAMLTPAERGSFEGFVGVIWSLKKQGEVTFTQTRQPGSKGHGASSGSITRIRATPLLLSRLGIAERKRDWPPTVLKGRTVSKVGRDGTDASSQPSVAPGGPIERRQSVDRAIPAAGIVTPDEGAIHPVGVDLTDHHNQPDETYEVPADRGNMDEAVEAPNDLTAGELVAIGIAGTDPTLLPYPLLRAIRAKSAQATRTREAVRLMSEAADLLNASAADALMEQAVALLARDDLSPIEEEYLKFADEVNRGDVEWRDAVAG